MAYDVYDRLNALTMGQCAWVDYADTLWFESTQEPNILLIDALKTAQARGIRIFLWTHEGFKTALERCKVMKRYGLIFDDVFCSVQKASLIIDNLAVSP